MKTALIFGITGQDGAYLTHLLLQKGYRVIGVSRTVDETSCRNLKQLNLYQKVEIVAFSMQDAESIRSFLCTYQPDEIYNLAGQSSAGRSFEIPVETFHSIATANLNVLEAMRCLKSTAKLFFAGSGDCFGDSNGYPVTEQTPFFPISPYAAAKVAAFWCIATFRVAYGLFACTGILFNHESILRPDHFVTRKIVKTACRIAAGSDEKLALGNIDIERDWGWAPEYVDCMWRMLQQNRADDYIIATGETVSLKAFVDEVFSQLSLDWRDHVIVDEAFIRPTDIRRICADPSRSETILGWKARCSALDVARRLVAAEKNKDDYEKLGSNI